MKAKWVAPAGLMITHISVSRSSKSLCFRTREVRFIEYEYEYYFIEYD